MNKLNECPICGSTKQKEHLVCNDFLTKKGTFSIVECDACHFHFTNPIPTVDKIGEYYKSDQYISHSSTKKGFINFLYNVVRKKTLKSKINWISSETNKKRLLDIGSGTGHFLKFACENGFQTKGLEPDEDARSFANEHHGLELSPIEDIYALEDGSFDVITMWHVLEHVYELKKQLQKITSLLSDDGRLFIAVPNMNSHDACHYKEFWAAYDVPRHLYHFKQENIEQLLQQFGYSLKKVIPMKYDAFYVSMLSEKYKNRFVGFGFWRGLVSNLKASKFGYSSQVYVFSKK